MGMAKILKFFIFSLVLLSLAVLNSAWGQVGGQAQGLSLQNFENNNGTEDEYFAEVWNCQPNFDTEIVRSGERSLRAETFDNGGTVRINFANEKNYVDLSKVKKISIWVYDTEGNNTVEIRLKDINGNGGSGNDGNTLWSKREAKKNNWTQIEWDLALYPDVEDLNLTYISSVEIYEFHKGVYYFDDLELE